MAGQFITNEKQLLSKVMEGVFPYANNLYFLVGYFYFSGFSEIVNNLDGKKLKILVGLDVEKNMVNQLKEVELLYAVNSSRSNIRSNFNQALVQIFNETDFFDNPVKQKSFKIFVTMIKKGDLEIRKTNQPNHAKLYLFENKAELTQSGTFPGTLITGSSNLTASGLRHQNELNVILRDKTDFEEGIRIFNDLWKDAIVIADVNHTEIFEEEVLSQIWLDKLFDPFLLYVRVLHELFNIEFNQPIKLPSEITNNRFINLKYQEDAIKQALHTIKIHNGVIISDVVGLGKSVIASAVAHNINLRTIIIAPPHLVKQWDDEYRDLFNFNAKVFSSGAMKKALKYHNELNNNEPRLIIIDEAHKYRNEDTNDYLDLHKLCQGNKVMLLTATPFNNKPQDLFSMIKLFQIPSKSTVKTVANLGDEFSKLIIEYKNLSKDIKNKKISQNTIDNKINTISHKIRNVISPLVIRRSRIDLSEIDRYKEDMELQNIEFSVVNAPELLTYDISLIEEKYINTLEQISPKDEDISLSCFKAVRYQPVEYLKDIERYRKNIEKEFGDFNLFKQSQRNIAKFMRHLLVRRFESSLEAFKMSVLNMIKNYQNIILWYDTRKAFPIFKKGNLPDISLMGDQNNDDTIDVINEFDLTEQIKSLKARGLFEIPAEDIKYEYREKLEADLEVLKNIYNNWFSENSNIIDPKLSNFIDMMKVNIKTEPKRKIIVFSEFADTINYLYKHTKNSLRIIKYTAKDAKASIKETIRLNFDAGVPVNQQKNDYDILLATDAISEGYNLHRAGAIINYDIPYNPTRVIQRIGRINRINKKMFDEINIFNYFPSDTGENETRTKEISTLKMALIQAILGEDTKILTNNEELQSFFQKQYKHQLQNNEERSWETPFLNLYFNLKNEHPQIIEKALKVPIRARIARKNKDVEGVLIFGKKGDDALFRWGENALSNESISPHDALKLMNASPSEKSFNTSCKFNPTYEYMKDSLFIKKNSSSNPDKLKIDTLKKLNTILSKKLSDDIDGINDIIKTVELGALPTKYLKEIIKLSRARCNDLSSIIDTNYIKKILEKAHNIDNAIEALIISEEFIKE
ncbi:hypothetical protein K4L44_05290 [Halosquirtibacter laminarini]|uniref:Uncharacterized protein n=1 Tax=Halosquirtibacter laminarini TaxID=3374600 RepID=A0AC61NR90_9BACT|nr:hypothetical protein K4L44_05290 [Prolixibacteraceae bacterium]